MSLEEAYAAAWDEAEIAEVALWDAAAGDGLDEAPVTPPRS